MVNLTRIVDGGRSGRVCLLAAPVLLFMALVVLSDAAGSQESADASRSFRGYPGAPIQAVVPRKDELFFYPCSQCHSSMEPNPEIRRLDVIHDAEIDHGGGRLWCLNCHNLDDQDTLRTLLGEPVDFDDSYLVCGGCHASRERDWAFGVHGKRVADWQGDRQVYNCTHCHNPHQPAIAPRAPKPPPPVRAGLELDPGEPHERVPVWQQQAEQDK